MTNRVEELESRVSELEATVKGLTEELVLANDRLRVLEGDTDDVIGSSRGGQNRNRRNQDPASANSPKPSRRFHQNEETEGDESSDDIIIA